MKISRVMVVTKTLVKSICLGVQDTAGSSIIMLITQVTDAINLCDVINLSTPILQAY